MTDLFTMKRDEILSLEGFKEKKTDNLLMAIQSSKGCECWRFINSLGIEHIGEVASKTLCKSFGIYFEQVTFDEILSLEGFGKEMAESILEFVRVNSDKIKLLRERLLPIEPVKKEFEENPFRNKTVVITGSMSVPRDQLKTQLEDLGAKIASSVSKKTDWVIYGSDAGSKYDKAVELSIALLTEEEFRTLLSFTQSTSTSQGSSVNPKNSLFDYASHLDRAATQ